MSRLIDRLKSEKNDPRSQEEITYDLGQQLEAAGNKEVFSANPDFFNEYLDIKDSMRRPLGNEIYAGINTAIRDTLPEQGYNAAAAIASIASQVIPGAGIAGEPSDLVNWLHKKAQQERDEAEIHRGEVSVPGIEQIRDVGDLGRYAAVTTAESLPQMLPSLLGGIGAAARGAGMLGTAAAVAGPTILQQTGEIYGNMPDEIKGTPRAGMAAVVGGIPSGALDAGSVLMGPLGRLIGRNPAKKAIIETIMEKVGADGLYRAAKNVLERGGIKGALATAVEGAVTEGTTEVMQEAISIAAEEYASGQEIADDKIKSRLANSGVGGGAAGAIIGSVIGLKPHAHENVHKISPEDNAAFDNTVGEINRQTDMPSDFGNLPLTAEEQNAFTGVSEPAGPLEHGPEPLSTEEYQALFGVKEPAGPLQFQSDDEIDMESFAAQALNAARGAAKLAAPVEAQVAIEADSYIPPRSERAPNDTNLPRLEGPPAGLPDKYDIVKPLLGPGNELYAADAPSVLSFENGMFEARRNTDLIRSPEEVAQEIWAYQESKRKETNAIQKQSTGDIPEAKPSGSISGLAEEVRKTQEQLAESRKVQEQEPLIQLAPTITPNTVIEGGPPLIGRIYTPEDGGNDAKIETAALGGKSDPMQKGTKKAVVLLDRSTGQVLVRDVKNAKARVEGERVADVVVGNMQLIRQKKRIIDPVNATQSAPWSEIKKELNRGLPRYDVMGEFYFDEPRTTVNFNFANLQDFEAHTQLADALRNYQTRGEGAPAAVKEKIAALFPRERENFATRQDIERATTTEASQIEESIGSALSEKEKNLLDKKKWQSLIDNKHKLNSSELDQAKSVLSAKDYKQLVSDNEAIKVSRKKQATGGGGSVDISHSIHDTDTASIVGNVQDEAATPAEQAERGEIQASTSNVPPLLAKLASLIHSGAPETDINAVAEEMAYQGAIGLKEYRKLPEKTLRNLSKAMAPTIVKQAKSLKYSMRSPGSWLMDPPQANAALGRFTRAMLSQGVDVVGIVADIHSAYDAVAKKYGIAIPDPKSGRPVVALVADWLVSNDPETRTVLDSAHEAAHIFMDKSGMIDPDKRSAFQNAIEHMGWTGGDYLVGPYATDLRILANTPSENLNPDQHAILARATLSEIQEARSITPQELLDERATEHLALLGIESKEARGLWQQVVRFVKDLAYQFALTIQKRFGLEPNNDLVKRFVENRWLQFINRDFAASNSAIKLSIRQWLGAPTNIDERIPIYQNIDGDPASKQWNPTTGRLEVIDPISDTTSDVSDRIRLALDRYNAEHGKLAIDSLENSLRTAWENMLDATVESGKQPGSPQHLAAQRQMQILTDTVTALGFTTDERDRVLKRAQTAGEKIKFSKRAGEALGEEGPEIAANTILASVNFENEVFNNLHKSPDIGQYLPVGTSYEDFIGKYLQLSPTQNPVAKKAKAIEQISSQRDAYGNPFNHNPDSTIAGLPVSVEGSSAQQGAIRDTIRKLNKVKDSLIRKRERLTERMDELNERKNNLTTSETRELDKIKSQIPMFERLLVLKDVGIEDQINRLEGKLGASFLWDVTPGASYYVPQTPDAGEAAVKNSNARVPASLSFDNQSRQSFFENIRKQTEWLANDDNRNAGAIYGEVEMQNRKLRALAVDATYNAQTFRLRNTYFDSLGNMLRGIGTPIAKYIASRFNKLDTTILRWNNTAHIEGGKWSRAYDDFKKSVGWKGADEDFRKAWWNRIEYYSENVPDGVTDPAGAVIGALENISRLKMSQQAKSALRILIRESGSNKKWIGEAFKAEGLKVEDPQLGDKFQRDLVRQGFQTGRRGVSEEVERITQEMRPVWNGTDFFDDMAEKHEKGDLQPQASSLFTPTVVSKFVEPLIYNNRQYFKAPNQEGAIVRMANPSNVRGAFEASGGDMVKFAQLLNELEGGNEHTESDTVASTLKVFQSFYRRFQSITNEREAAKQGGSEVLPRQIMDARQADDFPPEFLHYSTYDASANRTLLFQMGLNSAFGRNGLSTGEFAKNLDSLTREIDALHLQLTTLIQLEGKTKEQARQIMGDEKYTIALQARDHLQLLGRMKDKIAMVTKSSGSLMADVKLLDELIAFNANMVLQQPGAALTNMLDVVAPFYRLKMSTQAFAAFKNDLKTTVRDVFGSLLEAFGVHVMKQTETSARMQKLGLGDAENYVDWKDKMTDYGPGNALDKPSGVETLGQNVKRNALLSVRRGRQISNLGVAEIADLATLRKFGFSPNALKPGDANIAPKFRVLGIFNTVGQALANGAVDGQYQNFKDLMSRGVEAIKKSGDPDEMVRRLMDGRLRLSNEDLGYTRKLGIFNDESAYDYMKNAISEKMEEGSVEQLVADAYLRQKAGDIHLITDKQFVAIANLAMTDFQLNSNFGNAPIDLKSGGGLWRMLSPFLSWPYYSMLRVPSIFKDSNNQWKMKAAVDGVAVSLMAIVPITMAASMAFDWFDEKIVGKRRNLREAKAADIIPGYGPVTAPMATLERLGRYGAGGLLTEAINSAVNVDDARGGMTADNRILLFSQLKNFKDIVSNLFNEGPENANYVSVMRPFAQFLGLGGVLQYQQILNKQLGLSNEEAAVNNRINVANYLRAAGRDIGLDVRLSRGMGSLPNSVTPYLQNMEMAAYLDDVNMFRVAKRRATEEYHNLHPDEPDAGKEVIKSFQSRHPLKSIFTTMPSERAYRDLLDDLSPEGQRAVEDGVRQFNRYLILLGAKPVNPKGDALSSIQMIRKQIMSNEAMREAHAAAAQSSYYGSF